MAHSDRGHPSVSSSGPAVPIAIKKKRRVGCLRRAFPEAPPPLTRMKKNQKEDEGDDTNSNVSARPPDPRPPDDRVGPLHPLPPETVTNDPISRPETSSAGPNATRRQSVIPVVKTRLLFHAPQISDPIRRKGLPSRLPSRSMAGYTGYTPNLHSARMGAMSKGQPAESGKESLTRRCSYVPVPAPLFISEGLFFFFAPTP